MNPPQSNYLQHELRSGRVLEKIPRGRPIMRRRRVIQVTESASLVVHTQIPPQISISPPRQEATMGDQPPPLHGNNPPPPVRRMREYTLPHVVDHLSCIVLPPCNTHYEIKSSTLSIMPTFHALKDESQYDHLMEFEQACEDLNFIYLFS